MGLDRFRLPHGALRRRPDLPTLPPTIRYMLRDSGAVGHHRVDARPAGEDPRHQVRDLPLTLRHVIAIRPDATGRDVLSFNEVIAKGRAARARYPAGARGAAR